MNCMCADSGILYPKIRDLNTICIKGGKKGAIAKEHERQTFSKSVSNGYAFLSGLEVNLQQTEIIVSRQITLQISQCAVLLTISFLY